MRFEGIFWDSPHAAFAYVLTPFRLNERLRIQKGTFLAPGDITIGFEENLTAMRGHNDPANVIQIVIPAQCRRDALKHLYYMNVSRASLFPGLEGYARSLGVYHSVFDDVDDSKGTQRIAE